MAVCTPMARWMVMVTHYQGQRRDPRGSPKGGWVLTLAAMSDARVTPTLGSPGLRVVRP